jgi:hypothetical protein
MFRRATGLGKQASASPGQGDTPTFRASRCRVQQRLKTLAHHPVNRMSSPEERQGTQLLRSTTRAIAPTVRREVEGEIGAGPNVLVAVAG